RLQCELMARALTKVSAQKRSNPSASTFRDRHDDHIAARKLARTAAEISAHQACNYSWKPRSRSCFCEKRPYAAASTTCVKIDVLFYVSRVFPANGRPEQLA